MTDANEEFERLMERLRAGVPGAVEELHEMYGVHVLRAVRHKLQQRMRRQYDSLDFMQDTWCSFIAAPPETYTFTSPKELILYLARSAFKKVKAAARHCVTEGRDILREEPLREEPSGPVIATASQAAIADERWERLLEGLSPIQCQIVRLLQEGYTHEEAAQKLNLHAKAIQRFIRKLAERANS